MQQVIKGRKSLLQIPALLQERNAKEIVLVTGEHVLQEEIFGEFSKQLLAPYQLVHPPEGVLQTDAIPQFASLDTIIAIGGGKTIDFAKGIIYRHSQPAYLIAAPTTAGSGSEATPIAVFYNGKEKVSLDAPKLLPAVAVLDSGLLDKLPAYQRAVSGADALAQCIESVWNVHSTDVSEKYALTGLEMVWNDLPHFVNTSSEAAAEKIHWAAHLAGRAITLTRTTGPHALSYYLTANYSIPHGQAVALTLPLFFFYNDEMQKKEPFQKIFSAMQVQNADEAFVTCRQWMQKLGLATSLGDLQLQHLDLDDWLRSVNQQRFDNNPVSFDAGRLKELFQRYLR